MRGPTLACSTAPFFRQPVVAALEQIASAGFEHVEVMVSGDPATQDASKLGPLLTDAGLRLDAIHAPFLFLTRSVFGADPVEKIHRTVSMAEALGAPLIVVHPPYRWQAGYRRWIHARLLDFCAGTAVTVAVENMFPLQLGRARIPLHAAGDLAMLDGFPHMTLDTSHAAVAGDDLLDLYSRCRDRVRHVHLSNNSGRGWDSHRPVQSGKLPIADLLRRLAEDGFDGSVSLEIDLRPWFGDQAALRRLLEGQREFCRAALAGHRLATTSLAGSA